VGRLVFEGDVQPNVEVAVVHLPFQFFGQNAASKEHDPGMRRQVFPARRQ
jgi:hypothetical protein